MNIAHGSNRNYLIPERPPLELPIMDKVVPELLIVHGIWEVSAPGSVKSKVEAGATS
jgi:hypothetical protein